MMTVPPEEDGKDWLTVQEAAEWLKVSKWTVERACRDHHLPAIQVNRQWRILGSDLVAQARANMQPHECEATQKP